jgi:hypothetical protein
MIVAIQGMLDKDHAEIKTTRYVLRHERTGETAYTPPAGEEESRELLNNLENRSVKTTMTFAL